jgi:hypothetical protein
MPPWWTKQKLRAHYGWESIRSVDRAAADGRLPPPDYPLGPGRPLWDQEKIEANERAAVKRSAGSGGDAAA